MKKNGIFYVAISLVAVLGLTSFALAANPLSYTEFNNLRIQYKVAEHNFEDYFYRLGGDIFLKGDKSDGSTVGAFSGPDIYSDVNIYGSLTTGGSDFYATTTRGDHTFTFADLNSYSYWDIHNMTPAANLSFALPATSTMMQILPDVGSTRSWLIHNATTTGSRTLTLTAGAGMQLVAVTANDDIIDPLEWTKLTCMQIYYRGADNKNILCIVDELTDAD